MNQSGKATYISYHTRAEKEESCDEKGDSTKKNVNKSNVEEEKGFRILIGQFCLKIVIHMPCLPNVYLVYKSRSPHEI